MRRTSLDSSVKGKLMTVLLVGNVVLGAAATASFIACAVWFTLNEQRRGLDSLAKTIELQIAASPPANLPAFGTELSRLAAQHDLSRLELRSPAGKLLAVHLVPRVGFWEPLFSDLLPDREVLVRLPWGHFWLQLHPSAAPFCATVNICLGVAACFFAGLLLLGYLIRNRFDRLILAPIVHLTQKMEIVSRRQDYKVRVSRWSDDEIGLLFDCFNHMLEEISVRDERLALHREELEVDVEVRTRELSEVNGQLAASLGEVKMAMETAQAESRAKSDFLAQMSHEIRTPMYGVLGMTELLLNTGLTREQARYVETVRHSGEALLSIINSILDFSKIEAGRLELEIIPFDLHDTIHEALKLLSDDAQKKGLELTSYLDPDLPRSFKGDPVRLRQVVVNLLANAIKFTPEGEVYLEARLEEEPDLIRITVRDTGIGMDPQALEHIFDQFSQADQSITRRYGGTGLGLAIARQLTELMGGEISVRSEEGKGTTFSFTAQLERQETQEAPPRSFNALRGKRILIVEPGCGDAVCRQTTSWGMEAELAGDARGALRKVVAAPFDLALVAARLSDAPGAEAARALRSHPVSRSLAVVLLADPEEELDPRAEADLAAVLRRPVQQGALYEALVRALGMEPDQEADPLLQTVEGGIPLVLLVEDNEVNQEVGRGMLESFGCRVEIAVNGVQALAAVYQRSYDLVLMDTQMPEMDGLEATRLIREGELPDRPRLPIIALTAYAMKGDREACLNAGADDYLSKPFTREALAQLLRKHLADKVEVSAAADLSSPALTDEMPQALAMIQSLSGSRGLDILRKVVDLYLTSTPTLLQTLREAESGKDPMMLKAAAHSFKSSSANLGAVKLAGFCDELEALGRSGSTDGALPLLQQVEEEYRTVRNALMGGGI